MNAKSKERFIRSRVVFVIFLMALVAIGLSSQMAQAQKDLPAAKKGLIDLNSGSAKELESLKGIGPALSKKIIDGRPYKSVDDLTKVGIPAKTVETLKTLVTVGSASAGSAAAAKIAEPAKTLAPAKTAEVSKKTEKAVSESKTPAKLAPGQKVNINTASKEMLEALPGIGPVKAQEIIDGRPYKTIEDIMKLKGIKEGVFGKIKDSITVK